MSNQEAGVPDTTSVSPGIEMNSKRKLAVTGAVTFGALALSARLLGSEMQQAQSSEIKDTNSGTVSEQTVDGAKSPAIEQQAPNNEVGSVPTYEMPRIPVDVVKLNGDMQAVEAYQHAGRMAEQREVDTAEQAGK